MSSTQRRAKLLIDGQLIEARTSFSSTNPATGQVVGEAPDATVAEAEAAIAAARRAFDTTDWATDPDLRVRCLRQLHQALHDNKEELRELIIAEAGAPRMITHATQLEEPIEIVAYYADLLGTYPLTEELGVIETRGRKHRRWVEKEAAGVVAAITPYNYPVQIALAKIAPALAAGCTVVLKGAPDTPLVTQALGELIHAHTDIPAGVVNVISSSDAATGEALTTHPDVDMVTFTGSTATGRRIMEAAAKTVKRTFLELGGKSAMIVLDDADLGLCAMASAFMICSHAGQGCAITSRVLVPREHHDAFVAQASTFLQGINYGDPNDPGTYMGPLISERQRDKVHGLVERAVAAGATLVTGGEKVDPGWYYKPTLLTDVAPDSEIAQEEVFGPVLVVIAYDGEDEAVRIANDSIYGLSGAVFGADNDRAIAVARRIRSGTLSVNGGYYFGGDASFGGYKQSGIGREGGVPGFEEFLESKVFAAVVG
ncbi:aldehyde dehydrogenase family protein [Actinocorallia sp. A-T 12471]|uniref:aldehyde dehydrogenase family protein n=1 Tax=Actinocorallia sp. A-T 12471 TaxID=3089813 RepID=UPI0029CB28E5|nr:aldehyde dehydrogenase family protein [Actinocorallia sp. A-T 12471]MDX6745145.1 aldehyde dehydrogenase family protein [Actinocorallia sp. A-T 12471]